MKKLASLFIFLCLSWSVGASAGLIDELFNLGGEKEPDGIAACKKGEPAVIEQGNQDYGDLKPEAAAIAQAVQTCATNASLAQKACLESMSPNIAQAGTILGGMASAASQMQSAEQMCKNNGGAFDMAKKALTAYNAACSGAKASCDKLTCPRVQTTVAEQIKSAEDKMMKAGLDCKDELSDKIVGGPLCQKSEKIQKDYANLKKYSSVAAEYASCNVGGCQKYGMQLATAAAGIAQMISQMQASKECEDKLKNQAKQDQPLDCTKPENASNATCICQKNPRQAGCPGVTASAGEKAAPIGGGAGGKISGLNGVATMPGIDLSSQPSGSGADSTLGAGGGYGGGSGGGAGGKGFGTAGTSGGGAGGKYAPNSNIYGGDAGGGGAGGKSAGAGYADKYGKYAPTKEQARKLATGSIGEITGKSGKSNWDKVKERYSDNRASLLNK